LRVIAENIRDVFLRHSVVARFESVNYGFE